MTLKNFLSTVLVLFIFVGISKSATILIPNDYGTIQDGINASIDGDTILVSPGTYNENIDYLGKALVIKSTDGPLRTLMTAEHVAVTIANVQNGVSEFSGFSVTSNTYYDFIGTNYDKIQIKNSSYTKILNNNFYNINSIDYYGTKHSVGSCIDVDSSKVAIINNNFYRGDGSVYYSAVNIKEESDSSVVANNTFYKIVRGIKVSSNDISIRNNIFEDINYDLVLIDSTIVGLDADYNLFYENKEFYAFDSGQNNLYIDPHFIQPENNVFYLDSTSPCINAGDPSAQFNDPDNSRNDIGASPFGPLPSSPAVNIQVSDVYVSSNNVQNILSIFPTVSWSPSPLNSPDDSLIYQLIVVYGEDPPPTNGFSSQVADTVKGVCLFKVKTTNKYGLVSFSDVSSEYRGWQLGDNTIDSNTDISDLVSMVDFMFLDGSPFMIPARGDLNGDCQIDITDLILLVDVLFNGSYLNSLKYGCE